MQNVESVGDQFMIQNNPLLANLVSLSNLTSIGGDLYIDMNDALSALSGLENIAPGSIINLTISNNPLLSSCAVQSICDYLADPAGMVYVYNNATGCNTQMEVENACAVVIAPVSDCDEEIYFSPNPCSDAVYLRISNKEQGISNVEVYSIDGTKMKEFRLEDIETNRIEMELDVEVLPAGVYFCVLRTANTTTTTKLIKL